MSKICTKCSKTVYSLEELKCLDKVSWFPETLVSHLDDDFKLNGKPSWYGVV